MEGLFRQVGIYAHSGQLYEPVDSDTLLYYREAQNGQILEEGITEAGSMSSFIAAGSAHATVGVPMVPFFIYYSMFGFQRIGDLIWAAGDIGGGSDRRTAASGVSGCFGASAARCFSPAPSGAATFPALDAVPSPTLLNIRTAESNNRPSRRFIVYTPFAGLHSQPKAPERFRR